MGKKIAVILIIVGILICVSLGQAVTSFAAGPSQQASCMGQEAAAISPPGSSEELPGGAPELKKFIDSLGVTPGVVYRTIAKLHEGSHEACDEALE